MGEEWGPPTEELVVLQNQLRAFLDANGAEWQRVLDEYRADI